jgi:hypothetical protein
MNRQICVCPHRIEFPCPQRSGATLNVEDEKRWLILS